MKRRITPTVSFPVYVLLTIVTCGIYNLVLRYILARDMNEMCETEDGEHTTGVLGYILLSIVTCTVYQYVWLYKIGNRIQAGLLRREVNCTESGSTILLWKLVGLVTGFCACLPLVFDFVAHYFLLKNFNLLVETYNDELDREENATALAKIAPPVTEAAANEATDAEEVAAAPESADSKDESESEMPSVEMPTVEIPSVEMPTVEMPTVEMPSTGQDEDKL